MATRTPPTSAARRFSRCGSRVEVFALGVVFAVGTACQPSAPGDSGQSTRGESPRGAVTDSPGGTPDAIVYYFHNTIRCESCLEIERRAREAIEEGFASALGHGQLEWRVVNMELDGNRRFVTEYDLSVPSLVCSRREEGEEVSWQNLEDVWALLDDPDAFRWYVQKNLSKCLGSPESLHP